VKVVERDSIASVDSNEFERVWHIFCELGVSERHFNELQSRYRSLASTWLLATFVGIGFVASKETFNIPVSRSLAIAGLALAGTVGLTMLWIMDMMVYQQLLGAGFGYGLTLEQEYPWLPPLRTRMMSVTDNKGVRPRILGYYLAGNAVLASVAATALAIELASISPLLALGVFIVCMLGLWLLEEYVWRKTLGRMPLFVVRIWKRSHRQT
jgi:hypothetical protein